jgi:hypothetical protein
MRAGTSAPSVVPRAWTVSRLSGSTRPAGARRRPVLLLDRPGRPPPSGPGSAAGRTGALRCWSCSRRPLAWSPITSWPLSPLAASWLPPASRSPRIRPARKHLAPAPLAARHGPRHVVISLTAVSEPCWADLTAPGGATIFQGIIDPGISCSPGLIVLSLACRWRTCWAPRQAGCSPRTSRSLLGPATRCVSSALPASLSSAAEPVPSARAGPGQLC